MYISKSICAKGCRSTRYSLLFLFILGLPVANAADFTLTPYKIVYAVKYSIAKGSMTVALSSEGSDTYNIESRLTAEGLAKIVVSDPISEHATFDIRDNLVRPIAYTLNDGTANNEEGVQIGYDWRSSEATVKSAEGEEVKPLDEGTMDHLIMQAASALAVKHGETEFSFMSLAPGKDLQLQMYKYLGEETIDTKIGKIKTVKYSHQRKGSSRSSTIWFSTEHDYVPVQLQRMKENKVISTAKLKSLEQ